MKQNKIIAVIDIGRSHAKVSVTDGKNILREVRRVNQVSGEHTWRSENKQDYLRFNLAFLERWVWTQLAKLYNEYAYTAIITVTHGAAGVLVGEEKAIFEPMCYENKFSDDFDAAYHKLRPPFAETYSPSLEGCLNFGKQVFFFKEIFPNEFKAVRHILMYPQYWTWRLTGKAFNEITSLGSHSDFWNVLKQSYSSLAERMGLEKTLLPEVRPAYFCTGMLMPRMAQKIGIRKPIAVYHGIHDSSASFLRHDLHGDGHYEVISTGTWLVLFSSTGTLSRLDPRRDMYANVSLHGKGIPCAKFMGGREFEHIIASFDNLPQEDSGSEDLYQQCEDLIAEGHMVIPPIQRGQGPFGMASGQLKELEKQIATLSNTQRYILGGLYLALMSHDILERLGAHGSVVIEGAFIGHPIFTQAFTQIWQKQHGKPTLVSDDRSGTILSAALLTQWNEASKITTKNPVALKEVSLRPIKGLQQYSTAWKGFLPVLG